MLELFTSALKSPAGSFAFVLAILAICFIAIWKISHFTTKFSSVEKLESHIGLIKEDMHFVKAQLKFITDSSNPLAKAQSPVSLTEKGIEISNEIEADKMILNHWDYIKGELDKSLSKNCNAYDIQVEAFKLGEKFQTIINSKELDIIKEKAFKAGFHLTVFNILFGVIIRDKYLSTKGIAVDEIDKHDPSKNKST